MDGAAAWSRARPPRSAGPTRSTPAETGGIAVQAADPRACSRRSTGASRPVASSTRAIERYPTVVLGAVAAERLGIDDRSSDRCIVWIGDRWLSVVGILDSLPLAPEIDRSALVGPGGGRELCSTADERAVDDLRPGGPELVDDVRRVLPATGDPEHPEAVEVSRPSDAIEARAAAATAFTTLFLGLGAVALLVGGLGHRQRDAHGGARAAARRSACAGRSGPPAAHIVGQFLAEAVLLAGLGGVLGAAPRLRSSPRPTPTSQGWLVALPVVGVVGGVVAARRWSARWPASTRPLRAANASPTDALRD